MKCDECNAEECETRDVVKKYNDAELIKIVELNCNEFEPKECSKHKKKREYTKEWSNSNKITFAGNNCNYMG